jgi:DNA-binding SARP family transcriptional activator
MAVQGQFAPDVNNHGRSTGAIRSTDRPSLRLINGFELWWRGHPLDVPRSAQRLLALLALQRGPVQRPYVAGTLWTDASDERAAAALRTAIWRTEGATGHEHGVLVRKHRGGLGLAPEVAVDVRETTSRARALLRHPGDRNGDDLDLLLQDGELLPDWYDDWVHFEREHFRLLRIQALEVLCDALVDEGGLAVVAQANAYEALRQYEQYRALLWSRLGLEPSPSMQQLVAPLHRRRRVSAARRA